ncbi:FUN14 family-domain-containing protein, partial [Scleroderma citrinum]
MASPFHLRLNTCFRPSSTRLVQRHGFRKLPQASTTFRPYALVRDLKTSNTWKPTTSLSFTKSHGRSLSFLLATTGVGLGLASLATHPTVHCDAVTPPPPEPMPVLSPPPQSSVNLYELTFGTVCGVCAGVFIKKGTRMVAFFLGGVFVLLQYLGSLSLVKVDWTRMASRFENLFYKMDAVGRKQPPTIGSLFRWLVDFLTADFQARASFIAGIALGLRLG